MGWILFFIFLCIISFVLGWTILGWILVAFFVTAVVALIWINNESQKTQEKLKKINEERAERRKAEIAAKESIYNSTLYELTSKYGEPAKVIKLGDLNLDKEIIAFEQANRIWICGKDLSMNDILSCTFSDSPKVIKGKVTQETKTNSGNMVKRAVVGDVLLGGAGAVIGGSTASKTTTTIQEADKTYHNYTVIININNLSEPIMRIELGEDGKTVNEIVGLMNVIINRNR
ncbi:hypothetical protein ACGE0T_10825 [Parabacteroides sp. APC149_11_2_Y6]